MPPWQPASPTPAPTAFAMEREHSHGMFPIVQQATSRWYSRSFSVSFRQSRVSEISVS